MRLKFNKSVILKQEMEVNIMYNGRMTKKEKLIDELRNIVIDRYVAEGKQVTPDDVNNIYYSLFGVYERDGYDKAKEYALSAKLR